MATIVVGIHPGQAKSVLDTAARLAGDLHATLLCAYVDVTRFKDPSTGTIQPIDPDVNGGDESEDDQPLRARLEAALTGSAVDWEYRALTGEPATALAELADTVDAGYIVVGTRHRGIRASVEEFFTGSVAVHLAHRQHRPVVVVPLDASGQAAPWE